MRFFNEIYQESTKETFEPDTNVTSSRVSSHEFEIDDTMKDILQKSQQKFDSFVSRLSFHAQEIHDFGKNYIKSKKLSPDGVLQLAFQVSDLFFYLIKIIVLNCDICIKLYIAFLPYYDITYFRILCHGIHYISYNI